MKPCSCRCTAHRGKAARYTAAGQPPTDPGESASQADKTQYATEKATYYALKADWDSYNKYLADEKAYDDYVNWSMQVRTEMGKIGLSIPGWTNTLSDNSTAPLIGGFAARRYGRRLRRRGRRYPRPQRRTWVTRSAGILYGFADLERNLGSGTYPLVLQYVGLGSIGPSANRRNSGAGEGKQAGPAGGA